LFAPFPASDAGRSPCKIMKNNKTEDRSILTFALGIVALVLATKCLLAFFWQNGPIAGWIYLGATVSISGLWLWLKATNKRQNKKTGEQGN
jgi:hypothetical protein